MTTDPVAPIDRLRALIAGDAALQDRLAPLFIPEEFNALAIAIAAEHGIALDTDQLHNAMLSRGEGSDAPLVEAGYPPREWLPTGIASSPQGADVTWAHFAGEPLLESFFETSARRALGLPLNRLMRARSPLAGLIDAPVPDDALMPDGLIFHLSRCGSTLASQMIAALPGAIMGSEVPAVDDAVRLDRLDPDLSSDRHVRALRAIVAALGRDRSGTARHYVLKLDAWHMMALPLFRAAFPDTPWVFMYRDPVEVMVSLARQSGMTIMADHIPPATFGIAYDPAEPLLPYGARVLGRICEAARAGMTGGGGMLVNYAELPDAVPERMLAHFGIALDAAGEAAMRAASGQDVKKVGQSFAPDGATKRAEATPELREAVERHLAAPYAALEALRLS